MNNLLLPASSLPYILHPYLHLSSKSSLCSLCSCCQPCSPMCWGVCLSRKVVRRFILSPLQRSPVQFRFSFTYNKILQLFKCSPSSSQKRSESLRFMLRVVLNGWVAILWTFFNASIIFTKFVLLCKLCASHPTKTDSFILRPLKNIKFYSQESFFSFARTSHCKTMLCPSLILRWIRITFQFYIVCAMCLTCVFYEFLLGHISSHFMGCSIFWFISDVIICASRL